MEEEVSLYEYWLILKKHRGLILKILGATLLITLVVALATPNTYKAQTSFYFPLAKGDEALVENMLGSSLPSGISSALLPGFGPSLINYTKGILESRSIADKLISQFNLMQYYHTKFRSVAEKDLASGTTIEMSKEGIMEISVETKDPKLSANLANAYVDAFKEYSSSSTLSIAKKQRIDVQNQLTGLDEKLRDAEADMAAFQALHKTADFTQEDNQIVKALIGLRVQELSTRIDLETARETLDRARQIAMSHLQGGTSLPLVSPNMSDPLLITVRQKLADTYVNYALAKATETSRNPELASYREEVANLEATLKSQLQRQMAAARAGISDYLFQPETRIAELQARLAATRDGIREMSHRFKAYPLIELQYLRRARRLRVLEALYTFLSTEYEKARLEEEKETPDLQVLDKAVPPDLKSGPHRLLMLIIGFLLGAFLGVGAAFLVESFKPPVPHPVSGNGKPAEEQTAVHERV